MAVHKVLGMAILIALLAGACGEDGGGEDGGAEGDGTSIEITARDFEFDPTTLRVKPSEEITLTLNNEGETEHSFTSEELDVHVEAEGGDSAETTFTPPETGTFDFFCEYHPEQMTGTVSVVGGGDPGAPGGEDETPVEDGKGGYDY